jgi:type II secretory pathway component PulF
MQHSVKRLMTLIEPCCLVVMGGMVAFIMAAMLLPLFDMASAIRR